MKKEIRKKEKEAESVKKKGRREWMKSDDDVIDGPAPSCGKKWKMIFFPLGAFWKMNLSCASLKPSYMSFT